MKPQQEFRALTVFPDIPLGYFPQLVGNRHHEPHLNMGEWAVVDPSDRDLQFGELHLFKFPGWLMVLQILPPDPGKEDKDGQPAVKFRMLNQAFADRADHAALEHVQLCLIGRVVGTLAPHHNIDPGEISRVLRRLRVSDG